ncbi:hypothetical protein BGZ96_001449 [Linnemannia gamsii]|uniref:Ricin B lectin domain-containing protein n=1 Tax=Linnemannia gamsii TaxID=64522 RepID=A0ABQ7KA23_9FUNG|nr:hypothetical protein BGZ96_001449 [Linnemannia gamsii]
MHITSALAFLSFAALASAVKIKSKANGLCLDVPEGVQIGGHITLSECSKVDHGQWTVVKMGDEVMIRHAEGIADNNNNGWCVDHNPDRTGPNPTLWECNYDYSQLFHRNPETRSGADSFVKRNKLHELAVHHDDVVKSLANFLPYVERRSAKHEWTIVN